MPNRVLKDQNYRFGFNGKEADREGQWGSTEHYDYGFRIYDPKISRFLSVDPLTATYPMLTPYQFAHNTPIQGIDIDGLELLDAEAALINVTSGGVFLKVENASTFLKGGIALHNKGVIDMNNREIYQSGPYPIGISPALDFADAIGQVDHIARNGFAGPTTNNEARITIKHVKRDGSIVDRKNNKVGSNSRGRRKQRKQLQSLNNEINGPKSLPRGPLASIRGTTLPGLAIVFGAGSHLLQEKINSDIYEDYGVVKDQFDKEFLLATTIVLENSNLIDKSIRNNNTYVTEIINYVLQGEFNQNFDQKTQSLIENAAFKIILKDDRVNFKTVETFQEVNSRKE